MNTHDTPQSEPEVSADVAPEPVPPEEFPEAVFCPNCKRQCTVSFCHTRWNTLLTEIQLLCPKCRRKLKKIKLKDWYDHYIQGQPVPKVGQY